MNELPQKSQFLIDQAENGAIKIDVRFEEETVWLPQPSMAELFQTTQQNISLHLQNIYEEGELLPEATHKDFLLVHREGLRDVQRRVTFYNLDVIISAGYRVKSRVATRFRIWATHKEFLSVRHEGSRDIKRRGSFYNLDFKTYSFANSCTSGATIDCEAVVSVFKELRKVGAS